MEIRQKMMYFAVFVCVESDIAELILRP